VYAGVFEIHVAKEGVLADFKAEGEGWAVLSFDTPADPGLAQAGTLRIPFRAVPQDADRPIRLSFTYDGRRVSKAYEVGPKYFGRVGKARELQSVGVRVEEALTVPLPEDESEAHASPRGGAIPLRFTGRFVYTRSDGRTVGADHILVEVMDDDGLAGDPLVDETICWGYTDVNGYFDFGNPSWDDCDAVGCDEPDIYVRFECDTPVGQVQESGVLEEDYSWSTMDNIHEDFDGEAIHFGTMWPTDAAEMPAVHIWNSLVRVHRYIGNVTGIDVDHVDIQWPESENGAWYDWVMDEIHIGPNREWNEATHTHEYGHHFLQIYSVNPEPDYCNGYCDYDSGIPDCYTIAPDDCGHCQWCPETDHDAWNEGWPNWLADVVTRSYAEDYEFDDCTPYTALIPRPLEEVDTCCQDEEYHDPYITEGFVGALLHDIEDEKDDTHDDLDDDDEEWPDAIDTTDCMELGPEQIFDVVVMHQPETPAEFITTFISLYPQDTPGLWKTAQNVHPDYASLFPGDTTPPGPVTSLYSPTHPSGVGGALPCITVAFGQPEDDVTGSAGFSVEFTTDLGGVVPPESSNWSGPCVTRAASDPMGFGSYYASIRATDYAGHWGPHETFGPFVISGDCNSNGIIDLCDIECNAYQHAQDAGLLCAVSPSFCDVTGCGSSEDCNFNAIPDECDLASGTSKDCDRNGIPDECDGEAGDLIHWADGSGSWHDPGNWFKLSECPDPPPPPTCDYTFPESCPAVPDTADNVCINSAYSDITVTYTSGVTEIDVLASYENLNISDNLSATLALSEPSWVDSALGLSGNNSVLEVNDRLDIAGMFNWTGSNVMNSAKLKGTGKTYANGGVQISHTVHLDGHHLILDGNSTSVSTTGRVDFKLPSVFEIGRGSTYEHQGSTYILRGDSDDSFVNGGTLIKSVDPGVSTVYVPINNSGLIHVQAGTLKFSRGGSSTGDFLGDPGTTFEFNGGQDFLPSSSIIADNVLLAIGGTGGWNYVRGTYDVSTATTVDDYHTLIFTDVANIISYGSSFYIPNGTVNFNAAVGGIIQFDTLQVGSGGISGAGTANFNSGDPVQVTTLNLGPGSITGPSTVTIDGLLTWSSGSFYGPGTINADGDVLVNSAGTRWIRECVFNSAGTATLLGRIDMSDSAVFNNLDTGVMDIQGDGSGSGYVINGVGQTLNNAGTMVKSTGTGIRTITVPTTNTGTVEVQAGTLRFYTHSGGYYNQTAGQTVLNGGDLFMWGPASLQVNGGLLTGAGTITGNVLNTGGSAAPGLSAGVLDIDGNYTQTTGGTLEIDIAGLDQGSDYDLLTVSGVATLAGNLEVIISANRFAPVPGDSFQIITAGTVTGEFDPVTVPGLPPYLNMEVVYTTGAVTLDMVGAVYGDCDLDGDADLDDYANLEACLSGPGGGIGAGCRCFDFDDNGDVDLGDFAEFQAAFTGL
jgi:hypothetical protein